MSPSSASRLPVAFLLGTLSLLSAFLLFQVQPVISKYILPWFGGSPGVWTTCMVFFQIVLFAGYTYAHLLTKLRPRTQAIIHSVLMLAALAVLPIAPGDGWKPAGDEDPAGRILLLLLGTVGLPYFILSSTSPLAQVWFTRAVPGGTPWRLYALSNIGSLVALLSYPFFFEPRLEVTSQTWLWSGAFVIFAALSATLAWKVSSPAPATEMVEKSDGEAAETAPKWWHRLLWVALPALASVMLLATTNHVCQDVAVVPFMWVVPLSLYLLTFILCFEHERWYLRGLWALGVLGVVFITAAEKHLGGDLDLTPDYLAEIAWCFGAMFLACMVCHGELARLKPAPSRLTEFYLMMSAGGAIGGLLVSLVAPRIFVTYMEWPLALILCLLTGGVVVLRGIWQMSFRGLLITLGALVLGILISDRLLAHQLEKGSWVKQFLRLMYGHLETTVKSVEWLERPLSFASSAGWALAWLMVMLTLLYAGWAVYRLGRAAGRNGLHLTAEISLVAVLLPALIFLPMKTLRVEDRLERVRNFYGTVYVDEDYDTGLENEYRTLTHGGIVHGMQNLGNLYREEPVTYYGRHTGIGRALGRLAGQKGAKVGIVGLGAGTAACYAQAGHDFRFYEINPDVVRLARKHFTYLADAEKRGSTVATVIGDARLMLEREPNQQFDVLLLDAFSGDAIPMHLLTREAFEIYHRHMKPDGIIVVHVTNSYLILAPVVKKQADAMGWKTTRVITAQMGDDDDTDYMLVTQNEAFLKNTPADEPEDEPKLDVPLWTDRYHNLFQILLTE
jgi:SAM-dependent methyltransferase